MRNTLTESDVVFMYWTDDLDVYRTYGATVVAWGGAETRAKVEQAKKLGLHATATMWCLTAGAKELHDNPDLLAAVVRDIAGEPISVPWLPDHVYEGTPSWWGCTNNPAFRAHIRKTVCAAMIGGAAGLQVDDHLGTAAPSIYAGGCFCDYCMEKFRAFLQAHSTPALLTAAGVASFAQFDYRDLVRRFAATREEYLRKQSTIPLHMLYLTFQLHAAAENVRQLHELAEEIVERPLTLSANTGLPWSPHLVIVPSCSYLVGEVEQYAREGVSRANSAVVAYHLAAALDRPLAATAAGWDWAYVQAHKPETLVRYWIAQAYACGQRFMTPNHMWCFTPELGTHWYNGATTAYAPLYRFIRDNATLFDGYRAVEAETAILYSAQLAFAGLGHLQRLLERFAGANMPFEVEIAGDDWLPDMAIDQEKLLRYRQVIAVDCPDEPLRIAHHDYRDVEAIARHGRLLHWPPCAEVGTEQEDAELSQLLAGIHLPYGADNPHVWLFPRVKPAARAVIHLLNRAYNPEADTIEPQREVTIHCEESLFVRSYTSATLYSYDGDPLPLTVTLKEGIFSITVPELRLWALLVLE